MCTLQIRNLGLSSVSLLLYWTTDSNIRVVHRVKKRVIRATPAKRKLRKKNKKGLGLPGQIGEDCNEGEKSKGGQEENDHPSKCTSSLLGSRLHHSFPPPANKTNSIRVDFWCNTWGTNQWVLSVCISPPCYQGLLWSVASLPGHSPDPKCAIIKDILNMVGIVLKPVAHT